MQAHAFTTGTVRITQNWLHGQGSFPMRMLRTLTDSRFTEPLPIWCYLIEHPEGSILIDTGIPQHANKPIWFPPHMPLVQRAAPFQISSEAEEIGPQLKTKGFSPQDVRWVILTHLHQDHEGGLHHFPNADFLVARKEWQAAQGFQGRMGGYLNNRWPTHFAPTLIDFEEKDPIFGTRHSLTQAKDVYLVPTAGHSAGHLSVVVQQSDHALFFAGDASYTQDSLLADTLDGVGASADDQHTTHKNILAFANRQTTVYLPSHEWDAARRLAQREGIPQQIGA